jgi:hypothetical protein
MNEMARTSTKRGLKYEADVAECFQANGWSFRKRIDVIGPDGRRLLPDLIIERDRLVAVEVKVNGPDVGTMHEKWPMGVMKIAIAARAIGAVAVICLFDESGKLRPTIDAYIRPLAEQWGVIVLCGSGEIDAYAKD